MFPCVLNLPAGGFLHSYHSDFLHPTHVQPPPCQQWRPPAHLSDTHTQPGKMTHSPRQYVPFNFFYLGSITKLPQCPMSVSLASELGSHIFYGIQEEMDYLSRECHLRMGWEASPSPPGPGPHRYRSLRGALP